jgi:hypothetical protein
VQRAHLTCSDQLCSLDTHLTRAQGAVSPSELCTGPSAAVSLPQIHSGKKHNSCCLFLEKSFIWHECTNTGNLPMCCFIQNSDWPRVVMAGVEDQGGYWEYPNVLSAKLTQIQAADGWMPAFPPQGAEDSEFTKPRTTFRAASPLTVTISASEIMWPSQYKCVLLYKEFSGPGKGRFMSACGSLLL